MLVVVSTTVMLVLVSMLLVVLVSLVNMVRLTVSHESQKQYSMGRDLNKRGCAKRVI